MSEKKERFGRYLILDHLVDGGMAKICRARFLGEQADKVVVIKMIQPQYSSDELFKKMFMDEIKVTFGLLHPSIVQTYDYGLQNEQLFVAMEFCDGRNLKQYLDRLKQKRFVFPVEISIYIISQVCQGLHYAHTFTDKLTGKAAHIVHRDISPHNIMLTYDGAVKIIDFGIAKANTNSEATQAGTIKGKLSYLAPEYLEGQDLDPRYDMFSVGVTLWEMLCSRKLFKASNDLAILRKIQTCKVPAPSKINPHVPKELDEIVLKALQKDRNKRFENMDQFNRALIKFLYANYPDFNSTDLSFFAKELFKEEIRKDREKLFEFGKVDIRPYINDWKEEGESGAALGSNASSLESSGGPRKKEQSFDFGFEEESFFKGGSSRLLQKKEEKTSLDEKKDEKEQRGEEDKQEKSKKEEKSSLKDNLKNKKEDETQEEKITIELAPRGRRHRRSDIGNEEDRGNRSKTVTKSRTTINDLKEQERKKKVKRFALIAGFVITAWVGQSGFFMVKRFLKERSPASTENMEEVNSKIQNYDEVKALKSSGLRISNYSAQRHRVFVDGHESSPNFLKKVKVPLGKPFWLRVEMPGYHPYIKNLTISDDKSIITIKIPRMKKDSFGYLYLSRGCQMKGELSFDLYGEPRVESVPFSSKAGMAFPVKGDGQTPVNSSDRAVYKLYFKKEGTKIKRKIKVSFKYEDQRIDLCGL